MFHFIWGVAALSAEEPLAPLSALSYGAIADRESLQAFIRLRASYLREILNTMASGPSRLTTEDCTAHVFEITNRMDAIGMMDCSQITGEQWVNSHSSVNAVFVGTYDEEKLETVLLKAAAATSSASSPSHVAESESPPTPAPAAAPETRGFLAAAAAAAASAEPEEEDATVSIAALKLKLHHSSGTSGAVIKAFIKSLEAWLLQQVSGIVVSDDGKAFFRPDARLDSIKVNPKAKPLRLMAEAMPKNLRLNLSGRVVQMPVIGSLPLCQAFGVHFFVASGSEYDNLDNPDALQIAWLVKTATKSAAVTMSVVKSTVPYEFVYNAGVQIKVVTDVTLHSLVPDADWIECNAELVRPKIDAMITKETAPPAKAPTPEQVAAKDLKDLMGSREGSGESGEDEDEDAGRRMRMRVPEFQSTGRQSSALGVLC
eukprot:4011236-Pyramimonas_sp.AAC.1